MAGYHFDVSNAVACNLRRVGTAEAPRKFKLKLKSIPKEYLEKVAKVYPEVMDYAMPPRDAEAERKSLFVNFSKFKRYRTSQSLRERVRATIVEDTGKVNCPFWIPDNGIPRAEFIEAAATGLNPDANAGYPYLLSGLKKKEFVETNLAFVTSLVQTRMAMMAAIDVETVCKMQPHQLVQMGIVDPLRPIVKNEPHQIAKMVEGRYRLVICVSVVDELIDRLLFTTHNVKMVQSYAQSYSAIGIGFDDEKTEILRDNVRGRIAQNGVTASSDVKHWEYLCQEEDWVEHAEVTIACTINSTPMYEHLVRVRCAILARGTYVLEDGEMFDQEEPGVNKSGGYQTARFNTIARARKSRMIGSATQMCAGDDCVERPVSFAVEKYAKLGVIVKDYEVSSEKFDFCSHDYFESGPPVPKKMAKAVVKFMSGEISMDKIEQFVFEYQHAPKLEETVAVLISLFEGNPSEPVEDN
jgi:hypothetical protein